MKTYNTVAIETDINGVDGNDELSALFARALELCQTATTSETICLSSHPNTQNLSSEGVTYCIQHAESIDLKPIPLPETNFQEYLQSMQTICTQIKRKDETRVEKATIVETDVNAEHELKGNETSSHACSAEERVSIAECNKVCASQEASSRDMNTHDDGSPALKSKMVMDNNQTTVKCNKPRLVCTYCGKIYTSHGPFNKHLAKHGVKLILKDNIGNEYQETLQEVHISENNMAGSSSFDKSVAETQDHVKQHEANQENGEHLQAYSEERSFKCKLCDKTFAIKYEFVKHLQLHSGQTLHKCEVCNKGFTRKWYLAEHLRTHTGERPHKCQLCNSAFVNKANLNKHIQIHTGERQHKCGFCDKAFMRKHDIIRHLRIHTGERPYKCEYCEKAFMIKQHLVEHLRRHTGERPHKCGYCTMAFVTKGCLNKHARTHTGEIPQKV